MSITLKLLLFPEFRRALVGVDHRGIALLDTSVAEPLFIALQDALPMASTRRASIYVDQIQAIWGFIPGVHDDPWGSDGRDLLVWERWLETTSEDLLLELIDRVDAGADTATEIADWADAETQLSTARMLVDNITQHPDIWFHAHFLTDELAQFLQEHGWAGSQDNIQAVQQDFSLLFGSPQQFQEATYGIVEQRLPYLPLQPA